MSRIDSMNAQLKRAKELLPKIEQDYQNSLHKKEIDEDLKLDIQTYCGHLRAILDYLSKDIVETYCPNFKKIEKKRIYFPIFGDSTSFKNTMTNKYPELDINCKDLYDYLESIQPYQKDENKWLTQFNRVNNENKHNDLVAQTRTETRTVKVTGQGGGSVRWGPGVKFGRGVSVMGVPIDPRTQMPVPSNQVKTEVTIWVDFKFDDINVSVLALLKRTLLRVEDIMTNVIKYL